MSEQRMNTDETVDPRVSTAYRELADERTPEHLDHVVLNAARSAARPRWNSTIRWLRPAAWIATIGVCLAIVVEISLLQDENTAELDGLAPAAAPTATSANAERIDRPVPAAVQSAQKPAPELSADPVGRAVEAEVMKPARELRQQEPPMEDTAPFQLQPVPVTSAIEEAVTERFCDETQTADPNSWLECILELERQGLHEAARLERDRLAQAFPPPMIP
jgi:hypothetical protein